MVERIHCRWGMFAEGLAACGEIVCVVARAQIFPVDEREPNPQDAQLGLGARVPEPCPGSEAAGWIRNLSAVEKRADSDREEAVAIEVLVKFGIEEKIADSERCTALAAIMGPDMS